MVLQVRKERAAVKLWFHNPPSRGQQRAVGEHRQTDSDGAHLNEGFGPDSGPESQQGAGSSLEQPDGAAQPPALHRAARLEGAQEGCWLVVYL